MEGRADGGPGGWRAGRVEAGPKAVFAPVFPCRSPPAWEVDRVLRPHADHSNMCPLKYILIIKYFITVTITDSDVFFELRDALFIE